MAEINILPKGTDKVTNKKISYKITNWTIRCFKGARVVELAAWHVGREGQLEKRVDGDAAGVHRGNARGRHYHNLLVGDFPHPVEQGGLARAGLAGQKYIGPRVAYQFQGPFRFI